MRDSGLHYKFANLFKIALDKTLMQIFLNLINSYPKPKNTTTSIYRICLAIQILEKMGNKFPSQKEINALELILKRYGNRKSVKENIKKSDFGC